MGLEVSGPKQSDVDAWRHSFGDTLALDSYGTLVYKSQFPSKIICIREWAMDPQPFLAESALESSITVPIQCK